MQCYGVRHDRPGGGLAHWKGRKTFLSFPLRVAIQGKDGQSETVEIGVSRDGGQDEAADTAKARA